MKLYIKNLILFCSLVSVLTSCDLDVVPPAEFSAENFWKTEKDAWYALNGCYQSMPAVDIWDEMCTDNAHSHKPWEGPYELIQQNGVSSESDRGYSFRTIRIVNNFLEKVDGCEMDAALRERMKAEARYFRASDYLDLTTKFGKVPLVTTVMEYDAPNVNRDPVETVQAFILSELAEIAEILPDSYPGGEGYEKGRITRAGALALRARAALYFGNFAEAEASAGKIIQEGHHSLFRVTSLNAAQQNEADEMELYIDFEAKNIDKDKFVIGMFCYECLWHKENANPDNPEYLVTRGYMADDNNYDWTRYTYIRPSQLISGYSSYEPMQGLIDAYWDIAGKTIRPEIPVATRKENFAKITAVVEGMDQTTYIKTVPTLNLKEYAYMDEFRNRDSRLYASILFPLKGWQETDFSGDFYYMWDPLKAGSDGNESWTGYNYRKLVSLTPYQGWQSVEDYPIIRYAEVLLTYAEARVQNNGWDEKVQHALNDLRDRCGMPNVPNSLSKDAALELVRNERRIELAAEGHRYDDIRRYGLEYCREAMNGESTAPCGGFDPVKKEWQKYVVIDKVWGDRLLLMPIPTSAMDVNPLLKDDQNPGY